MRVLLVEDNLHFCQEVETYLSSAEDITFLGAVHTIQEFQNTALNINPEIILLDLDLVSPWDGNEILKWAKSHQPHLLFIIFTTNREEIAECYQLGAKGYLLKSQLHNLITTLKTVYQGETIIPPELGEDFVTQVRNKNTKQHLALELTNYSKREIEILQLTGQNITRGNIAKGLCISEFTVKRHIENILKKSKLKSALKVYQKFQSVL